MKNKIFRRFAPDRCPHFRAGPHFQFFFLRHWLLLLFVPKNEAKNYNMLERLYFILGVMWI